MAVSKELMSIPDFGSGDDDVFAQLHKVVGNFKKAILMTAGAAAQKLMMELAKEQEILMNIADMAIQTYAAESALLRAEKISQSKGEGAAALPLAMVQSFMWDAADVINKAGREALVSFAEGDELRMMLMGMKRFTKMAPFNIKDARRTIAAAVIEKNAYPF
jgi:precorrin-6x reductase